MMAIILNGKPYTCAEKITLEGLIELLDLREKRLAVEINLEIVPRSYYSRHILKDGDQVEIVHAIGGGSEAVYLEKSSL